MAMLQNGHGFPTFALMSLTRFLNDRIGALPKTTPSNWLPYPNKAFFHPKMGWWDLHREAYRADCLHGISNRTSHFHIFFEGFHLSFQHFSMFFFAEWWLTLNELRAIFMMGWQRQRFWQSVFGWFREPQEKTYGYGSKPGEPCGEPQICRDLWMSIWQIWYLDSDPSQVFCMTTNIPRNSSI